MAGFVRLQFHCHLLIGQNTFSVKFCKHVHSLSLLSVSSCGYINQTFSQPYRLLPTLTGVYLFSRAVGPDGAMKRRAAWGRGKGTRKVSIQQYPSNNQHSWHTLQTQILLDTLPFTRRLAYHRILHCTHLTIGDVDAKVDVAEATAANLSDQPVLAANLKLRLTTATTARHLHWSWPRYTVKKKAVWPSKSLAWALNFPRQRPACSQGLLIDSQKHTNTQVTLQRKRTIEPRPKGTGIGCGQIMSREWSRTSGGTSVPCCKRGTCTCCWRLTSTLHALNNGVMERMGCLVAVGECISR